MKSYNFKLNKFAQLIAAGTFALAFSAQAATDVVTTASVEVDGTITVNKLADLNFGRIVASV